MSPLHIENNMNIDNLILSRWKTFMKNGHFRCLNILSTVLAEGNTRCVGTTLIPCKRKYCQEDMDFLYNFSQTDQLIGMKTYGSQLLLLNLITSIISTLHFDRRPPQSMTSVRQKFNPDNFNFNKINKEKEMVAELCNLEDCGGESRESGDKSLLSRSKDIVIINVSPIDLGHCLLVPRVQDCQPQVLTKYSTQILNYTLPGFKIFYFNLSYIPGPHRIWCKASSGDNVAILIYKS